MKKLFLGSLSLFLTVSAFSQNGKVISAYNYLEEYNRPSEAGDIKTKGDAKNLIEAAKNIDIAIADPSTSGSSKAWWYRAKIYQTIETEKSLADQYPTASLEALKSYQKLKDLNDPKFKDWSDVYNYLQVLANNIFNDGVTAYQKKDYHNAYLCFSGVSDIYDILVAKGQKSNPDIINKALGNAGLSAEYDNDNNGAIAIYKKLLPGSTDAKVYISLVALYKKIKDTESAKKYTDEGLAMYPTEKELLIDKINFYMADNKYNEAISYLQKAAEQDPKNVEIQSALGVAYDQLKDTANARKVYENIIVLDPNNFAGNYGLGGLIFNRTKPIQEQMNALGSSKEDIKKYDELKVQRDAIFLQAKPYLEKANTAKPDDAEIKKALNTIEAMTRK
jgi:tetratricopeptide (TPR) repeat protein